MASAVFAFDGGDVIVFRSLAEAESGTEVHDIGGYLYLAEDGSVL